MKFPNKKSEFSDEQIELLEFACSTKDCMNLAASGCCFCEKCLYGQPTPIYTEDPLYQLKQAWDKAV